MTEEELNSLTKQLTEFLSDQAKDEGRGVFFVKMETQEIIFIPEKSIPEKVEDPESLKTIKEFAGKYDLESQICFLIFEENNVIFNVGEIE
ncbi:MAG: hypothetical protein HQM13_12430 [SAR324 cluster bacterium]|nr:hypothetical protein [SAR324 cluster bacterium]